MHFGITKKYLLILPLLAALSIGVLPLCQTEAAAPKADKEISSKMNDPAFSVPVVTNPITPEQVQDMQIVDQKGRWLVTAKSLEPYGIRENSNQSGYFQFTLPQAKQTPVHWLDQTVSLRLPGVQDSQGSYEVSLRQVRRPLGISYELLPQDRMQLLPPNRPVYTIPELRQQVLPKAGTKRAKTEIVLLWDPKMFEHDSIPAIKARTPVISPCAFSVTADGLELKNPNVDMLIEAYQSTGYAVWPLVDNKFNPKLTHDILGNQQLQEKIIKEMIGYALLYGFNGYNIDFENVDYADKDALSQFVAAIGSACKAYGLTTSIDVTVLSDNANWSLVYDRKALGKAVDYVALMAYDQFSRSGGVAGPVGDYPWVEKGVQNLADSVDNHKIILALNFYMRIWYEAHNDAPLPKDPAQWKVAEGAKPAQGGITRLDVRTLTLEDSEKVMSLYKKYAVWNEGSHAYYMEIPLEDGVVKIWFEDEKSLHTKLELIRKYRLGGAAFWRKGFENKRIWTDFGNHELT